MDGLTLSDVIESTHGHWIGRDDPSAIVPTGVSIDTRTLKPGEIFFALPGEEVDGHHFWTLRLKMARVLQSSANRGSTRRRRRKQG